MKKFLILSLLVGYTHFSNAQSAAETVNANLDTTPVTTNTSSIEARLNTQEQEIKALKKDNATLKKQMKAFHSSLFKMNRKITVSRTGSKQVVSQ